MVIGLAILIVLAIVVGKLIVGAKGSKLQYQTSKVEKGNIISAVSASGQILPANMINISTQATGLVKNVYLKNGDKVYQGQAVGEITLDADGALKNAQAWASLVSANNALNAANNNYRSTQASLQNVYDQVKGHASDETFAQKETRTKAEVANDNAYDAIKSASANLASVGLAYRQSSPIIVAPMAGRVDNLTLTPGMVLLNSSATTAAAPSRVAVIALAGNPLATFNVSEVDVNRVKPGQKATVTLDSISGKTFIGKVLTVDKIGTVSSGVTNYPVTISFDITALEILPSMAATARIIIDTKDNVLLVPAEAIQGKADQSSVRILRNGQVRDVTVEVGLSSDTQTEIVTGISEGDEVITGTISTVTSSRRGSMSPFSTFRVGGGRR